ncbi:MAG TPA: DUF4349 domain-containing protein [Bacteroidia bacterium]|nr:DUF4349 domain-containing protein [Bacteroidia bacterium]
MKTIWYSLLILMSTWMFIACSERSRKSEALSDLKDTTSVLKKTFENQLQLNGQKSNRKLIRSADLKFSVPNVSKASSEIESITNRMGGFVVLAEQESKILHTSDVIVTEDSGLKSTLYTVESHMTLRVPNHEFDTTLNSIATLAEFLDYRKVKAEDVGIQILANQLTKERIAGSHERMIKSSATIPDKTLPTVESESFLLQQQESADEAHLATTGLEDQIDYSTINLLLYQPGVVMTSLHPIEKTTDPYKPSLLKRISRAFTSGWTILENFLVFITEKWSLILILFSLYYLSRIILKRTGRLRINKIPGV